MTDATTNDPPPLDEELDDNYDDQEPNPNEFITVFNDKSKEEVVFKDYNGRSFICECKECSEFIPDILDKFKCETCYCSLVKHLIDEDDYKFDDDLLVDVYVSDSD